MTRKGFLLGLAAMAAAPAVVLEALKSPRPAESLTTGHVLDVPTSSTAIGKGGVLIMRTVESGRPKSVWLLFDGGDPNGRLAGLAGDLCLNGPKGLTYYCTGESIWVPSQG